VNRPAHAALFLCLLCAAPLEAQEQTPLFRTTSELVLVDVQVLQVKTGSPAGALTAKDLRVFEEGVPQQIVQFSRDEFPLSVVMLFDLTDSVRGVLKRLAEGAKSAMAHFKPEDEIAVMVYSGGATLVDGFTRDRNRTLQGIGKAAGMTSDQPAHFNEAIYQAAMQLRNAGSPSNRRVIVWLTDNYPNVPFRQMSFPLHTEIEAFRALHEDGVMVAPILMKSPLGALMAAFAGASEVSKRKEFPPGDAKKYAELTGGQAVGLRGKQPEERLAQLIDELRSRYTVGYRPPESQASESQPPESQSAYTFRRIRVELAPDGALRPKEWTVRAREGYYRKEALR
jgi:VWFA-related protein